MAKQEKGLQFGVAADQQTSSKTPFQIKRPEKPTDYPIGGLFDVQLAEREFTAAKNGYKKGDKVNVIIMRFEDATHKHIFQPTFWPVGPNAEDAQKELDVLKTQLAHIYEAYAGDKSSTGIGEGAKDFNDFFAQFVEAFNTGRKPKEEAAPVYKQGDAPHAVWMKLTSYKGKLQFPRYPNFLEKVVWKDVDGRKVPANAPNFNWNPQYDKVPADEAPSTPNMATPGGNKPTGEDLKEEFPSFV